MKPQNLLKLGKLLPSLFLITIAFSQIYRAFYKGQSPWKGGGFGMFAGIDSAGTRSLQMNVYFKGKAYSGTKFVESFPSDELLDFISAPTPEKLKQLGLQTKEWAWYSTSKEGSLRLGIPQGNKATVFFSIIDIKVAQGDAINSLNPQSLVRPEKVELIFKKLKFNYQKFELASVPIYRLKVSLKPKIKKALALRKVEE